MHQQQQQKSNQFSRSTFKQRSCQKRFFIPKHQQRCVFITSSTKQEKGFDFQQQQQTSESSTSCCGLSSSASGDIKQCGYPCYWHHQHQHHPHHHHNNNNKFVEKLKFSLPLKQQCENINNFF